MPTKFKVSDHVTWNSEAGRVSGKIIKVHTRDVDYIERPWVGGMKRRAEGPEIHLHLVILNAAQLL